MAFRIEPQTFEQLQEMAAQGVMPTNTAYAAVTMLLLYAAYGMVMEWRFAATAG